MEPFNFSFFSVSGWGIGLDYRDIEWYTKHLRLYTQGNSVYVINSVFFRLSNNKQEEMNFRRRNEWFLSLLLFLCSKETGEGNGNPPQCSCLENPRDGGAWGAPVYGGFTELDMADATLTAIKKLSHSYFLEANVTLL